MHISKPLVALAFVTASTAAIAAAPAQSDTGFYVTGSIGQANTKLDTSNTVHQTAITSDSTDKFGYALGVGYRFNSYIGTELSYVNFGKPTYDLLREDGSNAASKLTVKNTAVVAAVVGYLPLNNDFTAMGKVGAAFVHTKVDRVGAPGNDDTYHDSDNQVHPTFGIGGLYKLNTNLDLRANVDWYPNITKTSDTSTDTDSYLVSIGIQYKF